MFRKILLILFVALTVLSLPSLAGNDDINIDLLRTRDIIIRVNSFSTSTVSSSVEKNGRSALVVDASYNEDELTIFVDNYYGEVSVEITGKDGSVVESFYSNGGGEFKIDISDLKPGDYEVEIDAGITNFTGKISIKN